MYGTSPIELLTTEAMDKGQIYCQNYNYSAQWLAATPTVLGANLTVDITTQINGDSDFVVQMLQLVAWSAVGTSIQDPDFVLQLSLGGSARQLFDKPISVNAVCGSYLSDKFPASLPFPYLVEMNNNIVASLTNRTASEINRVDLIYCGYRVFYQGSQAPDQLRRSIFRKSAY